MARSHRYWSSMIRLSTRACRFPLTVESFFHVVSTLLSSRMRLESSSSPMMSRIQSSKSVRFRWYVRHFTGTLPILIEKSERLVAYCPVGFPMSSKKKNALSYTTVPKIVAIMSRSRVWEVEFLGFSISTIEGCVMFYQNTALLWMQIVFMNPKSAR